MQYVEKKKATQITSEFTDFDHDGHDWQEAFFRLLSVKNTFSCFYRVDILSRGDHNPYLWVLLKDNANMENIQNFLTDNGYRNLRVNDANVAEVWTSDDDVDYIIEA